jgi:hypothetical protein
MVNPRMRRLVGGLVAACGIVLSSFAVGLGGASAVPPGIPDQEDPPGDEAETTSTVRMRERCIWYVDGVPATINLLPTGDDVTFDDDGDPIGKVYDGSEYSLSVDLPELRAWNSGNESGGGEEFVDEHAFCTYFGATTGILITGTWSAGGFTATAADGSPDDNLDFDMTSDNPLAMTIDKGTCRTPSRGPDSSAWQFGGGPFETFGDWVKREIDRKLMFLDFAEFHYISALRKKGLPELFKSVDIAFKAAFAKLATPQLTRVLIDALQQHQPPISKGIRPKLRYAHQGGSNPPIVVIHGNHVDGVKDAYTRFLEKTFRRTFQLSGTPLRVQYKQGSNPFAEDEDKRKPGEGIVSMRRRKTAHRAELKAKKVVEDKDRSAKKR